MRWWFSLGKFGSGLIYCFGMSGFGVWGLGFGIVVWD